jgi:hypothetical protein
VGGRWEDLPAAVRLVLARSAGDESGRPSSASLFPDEGLPPHEKRILGLLKADQATHIDEIVEQLETKISPSEIFAALFKLELRGSFKLRAVRRATWNTTSCSPKVLQFLTADEFDNLERNLLEVQRMLASLVQRLQSRILARC